MFRRLFFLLLLCSVPAEAVTSWPELSPQAIPWRDGESLTYLVSWGLFTAAEGTFTAREKRDHWEFKLQLHSVGMVQSLFPFSDTLWSLVEKDPLRSTESGEWRYEPKRVVQERTQLNYAAHQGTREIWSEGKTKTFAFPADGMDDICSMLYNVRTGSWKVGQARTLYVYVDNAAKEGVATCTEKVNRTLGSFPKQPLLHLHVLPTVGTHRRGYLEIYLTDDARRLPLHADLEFRYGTFSIDLKPPK